MAANPYSLDDVDLAIIHELVAKPRCSYSDLAAMVGLSAGATKARVRTLLESRCVRIAGRVDPTILGHGLFAFSFVEVRGSALEAAQSLARRYEAAFVVVVGGSASLIVEFRCKDWRELADTIADVRGDPRFMHARVAMLRSYCKHDWSSIHSGGVLLNVGEERPKYTVDAIDMDILKALAADGRATYADIARQVAVSQGTARQRVIHLEAAGVVTVQTVVSSGVLGLAGYSAVGISVEGSAEAVAQEAAKLEPVALVATVFGVFEVVAEIGYRDLGHLVETLDSLRSIPGVKRLESFPYLTEVKESMEAGLWNATKASPV